MSEAVARIRGETDLATVVRKLVPKMADMTADDPFDEGTALLLGWSTEQLTLDAMEDLGPAIDGGEAEKDPGANHGRRLCVQGKVIEIHARHDLLGDYFDGGISVSRGEGSSSSVTSGGGQVTVNVNTSAGAYVVGFYAAGRTDGIVAGKHAVFCGIFTGLQSYRNVSGGTTHALKAVGMFSIPEIQP